MTLPVSTTTGIPDEASARACEQTALRDLQVGWVLALTANVSIALADIGIYPMVTNTVAILTCIVGSPLICNGIANCRLARRHRSGDYSSR